MNSLRNRLLISHLLPLLVVLPLIALTILYLLETQTDLTSLHGQLEAQTAAVAETLRSQEAHLQDSAQTDELVNRLETQLTAHVLILDTNGTPLSAGDSARSTDLQTPNADGLSTVLSGERVVTVLIDQEQRTNQLDILTPILNAEEQVTGILRVVGDLSTTATRVQNLRRLIMAALAIEVLIGLGLGLWLALNLERVFRRVTESVYQIARGEQPTLSMRGPREIRAFYEAINALVARLHTLEDARRRLLANLVHEIGRPLGALASAIYALRHDDDSDPTLKQDLLMGMDVEIKRLQPLLENLTKLHGQVLGSLELDWQETAIHTWLLALLPPWEAAAHEKHLQWRVNIPLDLPKISIDQDQMARAVGNLLSNAVKYTASSGMVTVTASTVDESLQIAVTDTGSGIPSAVRESIFEPFERGQVKRQFPQGLGLGLTIARDIVQAHGGTLHVESQVGQGSTFQILLPLT